MNYIWKSVDMAFVWGICQDSNRVHSSLSTDFIDMEWTELDFSALNLSDQLWCPCSLSSLQCVCMFLLLVCVYMCELKVSALMHLLSHSNCTKHSLRHFYLPLSICHAGSLSHSVSLSLSETLSHFSLSSSILFPFLCPTKEATFN